MNNNRKMKVGILGGTFDPIHTGHLFIAQTALDEAGLDEVVFVPSGSPPHKKNNEVTNASCRLHMVTEAISANPNFNVSEIDIDNNKTGYTYDLLTLLTERNPEVSFYFIMGADSFMEIKTWYRYDELLTMVGFIVMKRKGYDSEEMDYQTGIFKKTHQARIIILDSPKLEISSSEIRNRIKTNKSIKYLVPEKVEMYIYQKNLYGKD